MKKYMFWHGLKVALAGIAFVALLAFVMTALWNALMPSLFGLPVIGWLQALGLMLLGRLLMGGRLGFGRRHHAMACGPKWHRWEAKWASMSEEERLNFRAKFAHAGCCHPGKSEQADNNASNS